MDAASIKSTLQAKGQALTLSRTTGAGFDPVTGAYGSTSSQSWALQGVMTGYKLRDIDNSLILAGDRLAIVDAVSVLPIPGDTLTTSSGQAWKVIAVDPVEPAGAALLYSLQVRR